MNDRMTIIPRPITTPQPGRTTPQASGISRNGPGFAEILKSRLARPEVKFSGHANARMEQRGIMMTPDQTARLTQAVAKVDAKGGRDSLVLIDDLAMVVSIKNQTVVTVAERDQLQDNVFTNIDSAVIA
jgi:flagellar operon protein